MLGLIVNFGTIVLGGLIGLLINKGLPEKLIDILLKGMGLVVLYIGISGMLEGSNALVTVISVALGALIGGALDLDEKINRGAKKIEEKFSKSKGGFAQGFTNGTFMFLIGAMAIVGSIEAGLGDNSTLYTKAVIDGVTSIVFAATLGYGVIFSAIPVTAYQAIFVAIASFAEPYLTEYILGEISCIGGLLIFAIGLNLMKITNIKVMNLMPSMFMPLVLCLIIK